MDPNTRASFEEFQGPRPDNVSFSSSSRMTRSVLRYSGGLVRTERQATFVLAVFAALALGVALFFFFNGADLQSKSPYQPTTEYGGKEISDDLK